MAFVTSLNVNITYAGDSGFLVLSDGYLILPNTNKRTWGGWGWYLQEPWAKAHTHDCLGHAPFEFAWPISTEVRQIGANGLHIPLILPITVLIWLPLALTNWKSVTKFSLRLIQLCSLSFLGALLILIFLDPYDSPLDGIFITTFSGVGGVAILIAAIRLGQNKKLASRLSRLRHLCPTCRYNLTGNTSGVCPECGNATPTEPIRTTDV